MQTKADAIVLKQMGHMAATMVVGMLGATVLVGGLPRVVAGTPTLTLPFHIPIGPGFTPPVHALIAKNHGHMFMGSLNYQDDLQRVEYAYEGMWKLVRRRDERGQLGFVYDSEERLLRVSNENWEHYHFDLDDAGFVIGERGFDRGYRSYQRDRAGRVIRRRSPVASSKSTSMTSVAVSHALPTTTTRSRSRPTATTARDACKRQRTSMPL